MSIGSDIGDLIFDNMGKIVLGMIVLLVVALILSVKQEATDKAAFMAECSQHRENYECVAMWRAGEKNDTYIPVVIPIR